MSAKRLRDCRGFVELINELCSCGGNDRANGCDACKIYHAIGDWLIVEATAPTVIASDAMKPGEAMLTDGKTAVLATNIGEPVEKRCGTCAANGLTAECWTRFTTMPNTGHYYHCWKAKP